MDTQFGFLCPKLTLALHVHKVGPNEIELVQVCKQIFCWCHKLP